MTADVDGDDADDIARAIENARRQVGDGRAQGAEARRIASMERRKAMEEGRRIAAEERRKAFANREAWIEPLGADGYTHQINNMIHHFDFLGVVEVREGPGDPEFPATIEVEDYARLITPEQEKLTGPRLLGAAPPMR
ncbi:hypothetical protein LTR94_032896, partial [Friedmanniomyces endolithicus]